MARRFYPLDVKWYIMLCSTHNSQQMRAICWQNQPNIAQWVDQLAQQSNQFQRCQHSKKEISSVHWLYFLEGVKKLFQKWFYLSYTSTFWIFFPIEKLIHIFKTKVFKVFANIKFDIVSVSLSTVLKRWSADMKK